MSPDNNAPSYRWLNTPRWYLWDGGFLLLGQAQGVVPAHSHHAIQIVFSLGQPVAIRGSGGPWRPTHGLIVRPDATHSFDCSGALGAMLFVDPESSEGIWLKSLLTEDITLVPPARLSSPVSHLQTLADNPMEALEAGTLIRHCVCALSPGAPPSRSLDARITTVLDHIRGADDLRIPLDTAAAKAFLSPSRFAHLFRAQVGLPFSRYLLWRKLTRAMLAIGSERTIAAAAHAAGFADAAHLTRTFYQMVGMAPSVLMRGTFTEIPPPFK